MSPRGEWRFDMARWLFFTGLGVLFTWSAARAGDWTGVIVSLLFLIFSLAFLVFVWRLRPPRD